MLRLSIYIFFLCGGSIYCMESPEISLNELQKDLVTDLSELQLQGKVPSLYKLAQQDSVLFGSLVQTKFSSKEELETVRPVQIVFGKIIGGPFSMKQAIRAAGIDVMKRIFGHESTMQGTNRPKKVVKRSVSNDVDTISNENSSSLLSRLKRQNHEEPLLTPSSESSDATITDRQWFQFRPKPSGKQERELQVDRALSVADPIQTLLHLRRFPNMAKGKVIAGDINNARLISERELKDINQAWIAEKYPRFQITAPPKENSFPPRRTNSVAFVPGEDKL